MKAADIRNHFINFFESKSHKHEASSSLVPQDDPTLLFANAGMNQFKDYFTGKAKAENPRAVTSQKCTRAGGKHNDLENVGFTARHHTFFEMLGNFSFGDYFKEDAIKYAWEFLTQVVSIPPEKLFVSVHDSDDEALELWVKTGVPKERIFKMGDADNFWEMGDVGPCGPCSEIYYDHGPKFSNREIKPGENPLLDDGRYVEIWNLVFMQFEQTPTGREKLPKPSVDTGMGLERLAACLQGVYWNYDTDLFTPIIKAIESLSGASYNNEKQQGSIRVISDHIRASVMLITDGVIPSNEGRGYVLRRIIRRAIRHLNELGVKETSFYKLIPSVFDVLGSTFPENKDNSALAEKLLKLEEIKFRETLELGIKLLEDEISALKNGGELSGSTAFKLYDTYGFPLDLTEVILLERGYTLDQVGFDKEMEAQRSRSKQDGKFQVHDDYKKIFYGVKEKFGETEFVGYEEMQTTAELTQLVQIENQYYGIFNKTPFYGESGGQVGDIGEIRGLDDKLVAYVEDTIKPVENLWAHQLRLLDPNNPPKIKTAYQLKIDKTHRDLIKRNHSATHLLQAALTHVLGKHVKQAGSLVTAQKLRFDFTHTQAVSNEEIDKINKLVNFEIKKQQVVTPKTMSKDEALQTGATALFGEKYGDEVRVISMGDFSTELCGGTHVSNTSDIQYFTILSETSLASGIRRIEAVSSYHAFEYLESRSNILAQLESHFGLSQEQVLERMNHLAIEVKNKNKEIAKLTEQIQTIESKDLFTLVATLKNNITITTAHLLGKNTNELRSISDHFFNENDYADKSVLILTSLDDSKISFLVRRANQSYKSMNLNQPLKEIFKTTTGRGGGKPDLVQGSIESSNQELFVKEWIKNLESINV